MSDELRVSLVERRAREMFAAEFGDAEITFRELPEYAKRLYLDAAGAALERQCSGEKEVD